MFQNFSGPSRSLKTRSRSGIWVWKMWLRSTLTQKSIGVTDGGRGTNHPPGKLNVKNGPPLRLCLGLVFFWLSVGCCGVFSGDLGFYFSHPHRIHQHFSSFFSECWLVDLLQWPVGPFQLRLSPWIKPLVTPLHKSTEHRVTWLNLQITPPRTE